MLDMIRQFAEQLNHDEKVALAADLKQIIAEELAGAPGEPGACPHCGRPKTTKRGRDAKGAQTMIIPFSRWPSAPLWSQGDSRKGKSPEIGTWISAKRGTPIGASWNCCRLCVL